MPPGPTGAQRPRPCQLRPRRPSVAAGRRAAQRVARARAAVGLGLHPATLPRPRARCSRFGGGWRRLAEVQTTPQKRKPATGLTFANRAQRVEIRQFQGHLWNQGHNHIFPTTLLRSPVLPRGRLVGTKPLLTCLTLFLHHVRSVNQPEQRSICPLSKVILFFGCSASPIPLWTSRQAKAGLPALYKYM
eukprot:gene15385-biopygen14258